MPIDRQYPALRFAVWEAYDRQCCYCRHPLSFRDLQIDHVIPEAVINDAAKWKETVTELDLSSRFDPQGLENLVAACSSCNARKSGTSFDSIVALIPLRLAARMKRGIEKRIHQYEREAKETKLDVLIALRRTFDVQSTVNPDRES